MNKSITLILCLCMLASWSLNAQQRTCNSDAHMEALLQDTKYAKDYQKRQLKFEALNQENPMRSADCTNMIYIPMAVHYQGVSDPDVECLVALAEEQIQILNDDYQGVNADITNWTGEAAANFPGISNGESCIQFCLGTRNHPASSGVEDGAPAITFTASGADNDFYPEWTGYINIFVRNIGGGILGYSPLGGEGTGDGVVMNSTAFSQGSGCTGFVPGAPFNYGRTLTHELGHYLNLNHIWGGGGGGCGSDDGVSDTPNSSEPYYGCPNLSSNSCGSTDMHMNYMDYVNDLCMYVFSAGQVTRMENYVNAALQHVVNNAPLVCPRDSFDLAPIALDTPQDGADLAAGETVSITIKNFGLDTISNYAIGFWFEGNPVDHFEVMDTLLAPQETYSHTFANTVDFTATGNYEFKIYTTLSNDEYIDNDTLRTTVKKLAPFDAGIMELAGPELLCGSDGIVSLTISNPGGTALSSLTINYTFNGNAADPVEWTGNLAPGQSTTVQLDVTGAFAGTNSVEATISSPNGETDGNMADNSYSASFEANPYGEGVEFNLLTDNYPAETSWDLRDGSGNIVYVGGGYEGEQTLHEEEWCLDPEACYTFTIYDSYGDGIQFNGVVGDYEIIDAEGEVLVTLMQANFGDSESQTFCLFDCNMNLSASSTPDTNNIMNGTITAILIGNQPPTIFSLDGGPEQSSNVFTGLSAGTYEVVATDAIGCTAAYTIEVEAVMVTGTAEVYEGTTVQLEPNPTSGLFTLTVESTTDLNQLELSVIDATGKVLHNETAQRSNGLIQSELSLEHLPSGVYFVQLKHDEFSQIHKVVKL